MPKDVDALARHIDEKAAALDRTASALPLDQEKAAARLHSEDLGRIKTTLRRERDLLEMSEDRLRVMFNQARSAFDREGVDPGDAQLVICDEFPAPYQDMDFWAMSFDASDHEQFGIDVGVAVKRKYFMPLYSPFLVAHELVHASIGKVKTPLLARGLEDGLADIFGSLYVGSQLLDESLCKTTLLQSRVLYGDQQIWDTYADSLRLALDLLRTEGWEGFRGVLQRASTEGRQVIKDAERRVLANSIPASRVEESTAGPPIVTEFGSSFLRFPRSLVVSPLALVLARELKIDCRVSEICATHSIDPKAGELAANELQQRVFLALIDDGVVVADETKMFVALGGLRYEV